jgi:flagellin
MTRISPGIHGTDQQLLNSRQRNSDRTQTSVERLSTGKRINRPKDDPAGFIAAEGLRQELSDLKLKLGDISTERAQSHIKQSGLANIQDALTDLRGRLVSVADGSLTADQRASLENEIDEASRAVNRIARTTGTTDAINLSVEVAQQLSTDPNATQIVDDISQGVTNQRVALAAHERTQLDTFQNLYQDQVAITSEALSQIEDTDFAAEASNLVQSQILTQSATAALAYSSRQHAGQLTQLLDSIA